ncbi:ketohexokinase-like isoform X1 [Schistocerca gregaria]|uniref:ketohexokinase-like isoform X1 n=1 Tax=Schistocerca gregaria TaxID=7010 RepID=UPI00211E4C0E|nr:ketohexokinase-like isoform X1 [Schistocerca gregaria]
MTATQPKILCVGMICVDELLYCKSYPIEDSDQRILDRQQRTGGNAANNCAVLAELKVKCDLLGTLSSNSRYTSFVKEDLRSYGLSCDLCELIEGQELPISTCIINAENGTRTILHYRKDWPEASYEAFLKIDLSQYSWIHFEGRNIDEVKKMIKRIVEWNNEHAEGYGITISIEVEKKRDNLLELIPLGDLVIIGKDFARLQGFNTMSQAVDGLFGLLKHGATLVVPWGEEGAAAKGPEGVFLVPACPPERVLDTLGAGDTFCAALLSALSGGHPLQQSLRYACKVAGAKVGMHGYHGLRDVLREQRIAVDH